MIFGTLFSGSKGNCSIISDGETHILIDAGRSLKYITESLSTLGLNMSDISDIFITHEHSDHISALRVICKRYPSIRIHAALGTARAISDSCGECLTVHPPIFELDVGSMHISSFPIPHDAASPVGYRIKCGEHTLGYGTDIGYINESVRRGLLGCDMAILESNHDPEMLMCGPYSELLKMRIASERGHLSNDASAGLASDMADDGCTHIILAHLSETNNLPALALESAEHIHPSSGRIPCFYVASPTSPTVINHDI